MTGYAVFRRSTEYALDVASFTPYVTVPHIQHKSSAVVVELGVCALGLRDIESEKLQKQQNEQRDQAHRDATHVRSHHQH
jgi:hypothetical protein